MPSLRESPSLQLLAVHRMSILTMTTRNDLLCASGQRGSVRVHGMDIQLEPDPSHLVECLRRALHDEALREAAWRIGPLYAQAKFSWSNAARTLLQQNFVFKIVHPPDGHVIAPEQSLVVRAHVGNLTQGSLCLNVFNASNGPWPGIPQVAKACANLRDLWAGDNRHAELQLQGMLPGSYLLNLTLTSGSGALQVAVDECVVHVVRDAVHGSHVLAASLLEAGLLEEARLAAAMAEEGLVNIVGMTTPIMPSIQVIKKRREQDLRQIEDLMEMQLEFSFSEPSALQRYPIWPNMYWPYRFARDELMMERAGMLLEHLQENADAKPVTFARPGARTKVAFISPNLYTHSLGKVMIGVILGLADMKQGSSTCTSLAQRSTPRMPSLQLKRLKAGRYHTLSGQIEMDTDAVRQTKVDAIVFGDIHSSTLLYAIAMKRLAPVQAVFWGGHPFTTSLSTIDYFIIGREHSLSSHRQFLEQVVQLPFMGTSYPAVFSTQGSTQEHPQVEWLVPSALAVHPLLMRWYALFTAAQASKSDVFGGARPCVGPSAQEAPAHALCRNGSGEWFHRANHPRVSAEYQNLMRNATVVLNTFPYSGFSTSIESFSMQTPVVSLISEERRAHRKQLRCFVSLWQKVMIQTYIHPAALRIQEKASSAVSYVCLMIMHFGKLHLVLSTTGCFASSMTLPQFMRGRIFSPGA